MMLRAQSLTASASVSNHRCAFRIKRDALCNTVRRRRWLRRICKWRRGSLEKEEEEAIEVEVEIDRAKAREALKQLDQQLQSLSESQPQPQPPLSTKTKPSNTPEMDSDLNRDFFMRRDGREEMPEISDSYLAYTAGALVLLTILNNIVFSFFIKPSIDGYQKPIVLERVPLSEPD